MPADKPEIPVIALGADQSYVVPAGTIFICPLGEGPFAGATVNADPVQTSIGIPP